MPVGLSPRAPCCWLLKLEVSSLASVRTVAALFTAVFRAVLLFSVVCCSCCPAGSKNSSQQGSGGIPETLNACGSTTKGALLDVRCLMMHTAPLSMQSTRFGKLDCSGAGEDAIALVGSCCVLGLC
jgi:hypothetical protein